MISNTIWLRVSAVGEHSGAIVDDKIIDDVLNALFSIILQVTDSALPLMRELDSVITHVIANVAASTFKHDFLSSFSIGWPVYLARQVGIIRITSRDEACPGS